MTFKPYYVRALNVGDFLTGNTTGFWVGANVSMNATAIAVGAAVLTNTTFTLGSINANTTAWIAGSSVVNTTAIAVGANVVANSTAITTGAFTANATGFGIGSVVANSTVLSAAGFATTNFAVNNTVLSVGSVSINTTAINLPALTTTAVTVNATVVAVGANVIANTTFVVAPAFSTSVASMNTTAIAVGANVIANTTVMAAPAYIATTSMLIGNSTVNTAVTTSSFSVANSTVAAALGIASVGATSNTGFSILSNNAIRITVAPSGNVGIGNTAPADNFHVQGNIIASGDITTAYSDMRLKTMTFELENVLDKLRGLQCIGYVPSKRMLELDPEVIQKEKLGLYAQQVQRVFPQLISLAPFDRGPDGSISGEDYITIDYTRMVPVLVQAIKELDDKYQRLLYLRG